MITACAPGANVEPAPMSAPAATYTPYPTFTAPPPRLTYTAYPTYTPLSPLATYTSYPTLTLVLTLIPAPTETAVDLTATLDSEVSIFVEVIAEKTVLRQIKSYNKKGDAIMRVREPRIRYERGELLQVYSSGGEDDGPLYRTDGADYYYRIFDPDGQEEELYVPSWHVVIVP